MLSTTASIALLDRICLLTGDPPKDPAGDFDSMAEFLVDSGVAHRSFTSPVGAAISAFDETRPLLAIGPEDEAVLLMTRRGSRVRADVDGVVSWFTAAELASVLGLSSGQQEHEWFAIERSDYVKSGLGRSASPWKDTLVLLRGEKGNIGAITIYAVGVGLLSLALPLAVQTLVNTVAFGQLLQPIFVLTLMLAAGLVLAAGLNGMQTWVVEVVQRRIFVRLVSELAERLPRAHIMAFERGEGPELLNRFFDIFTAQKAASGLLLGGIGALLTAIVGIIVLAFYHPLLLAFGVILTFAVIVTLVFLGRGATKTTIEESKAKYAVAGWLQEMARHPFALKMSGGDEFAKRRVDELASVWLRKRSAHFRVFFRQLLSALALQVIAHATLLGVGGWLVVERELSIGQLVAAELIVTAIVVSLSKLGAKLETVYDLVAAVDKLGALLALPVEEAADDEARDKLRCTGAAKLELDNVSTEDGRIENLSLKVEASERVAIRASRRRSAPLIEMLFGLRTPSSGSVQINGQDLRDLDRFSIRAHVGVVRDQEIMPATISDNIQAGRTLKASEMWDLLRTVGLEDTVRSLPAGLRTVLSPSAYPLDKTESLRLTLARVLAAKPSLLVLDGVIDALPEHERAPFLDAVSNGRTTLIRTNESSVADQCSSCVDLTSDEKGRF
ncbi:MAG: putative ABC transport system ATP-binding protein [Polyangiales bacterium]|jgi:putative ABC transport system ATP-binding protein